MNKKTTDIILEHFDSKTSFALELALRDASVYGLGLVALDVEGNVTYLDLEEAVNLAEKALSEAHSNK